MPHQYLMTSHAAQKLDCQLSTMPSDYHDSSIVELTHALIMHTQNFAN